MYNIQQLYQVWWNCGISYLIHNEMKKMQEKLEEHRLEASVILMN